MSGCDGFAGRILEQSAGDPFHEGVELFVGKLWPVGWHKWFLGVSQRLPELAALRISGNNYGARAAALERALKAGEVKVGLLLVGMHTYGGRAFREPSS